MQPPLWLTLACVMTFGLLLSAPMAVAAAWLFERVYEAKDGIVSGPLVHFPVQPDHTYPKPKPKPKPRPKPPGGGKR